MKPVATKSTAQPHSPRRHARELVGVLVGCALAAIIANTWFLEGIFAPVIVHGGSMAPALLGAHRQWQCPGCGETFLCNLESLPAAGKMAICPHCGAANDPQQGADAPGERLWIDRSAFHWRGPRRWETVVVRSPENPGMLCVKRVVGLPGETIAIADGDLLVDGAVARKSLAEQRAMAVAICTARDRWQSETAGAWQLADGRFLHPAGGQRIDWLGYHHAEHCVASRSGPGAILDGSAFDQNESRLLDEVADVILRGEFQASGSGTLYVRTVSRGDVFLLELDMASGTVELAHNGHLERRANTDKPTWNNGVPVELIVADRRVQLVLAGKLTLELVYEPVDGTPKVPEDGPQGVLAVGARGAAVQIRNLRVLRDLYYTPGPGAASQYRLAEGEYFLLGDNSARSRDSRHWPSGGGVSADLLVGRAVAW